MRRREAENFVIFKVFFLKLTLRRGDMKAIIMAGGKGLRLRPLTDNIPKPMVKIIDKPVLQHIIELCRAHNITDIGITLGYKSDCITDYFGNGDWLGVKITYFFEDQPLGTAGGVKNAKDFVSDDFIVLSGDAYTTIDLSKAIDFHFAKNSSFTLIATPHKNPEGLGILETDHDGKITAFIEKPENPRPSLINCGIYIMKKAILDMIPEGPYDFGKQLIPRLAGKAYAFVTYDYWSDIGTLPSYYYTNYLISLGSGAAAGIL